MNKLKEIIWNILIVLGIIIFEIILAPMILLYLVYIIISGLYFYIKEKIGNEDILEKGKRRSKKGKNE